MKGSKNTKDSSVKPASSQEMIYKLDRFTWKHGYQNQSYILVTYMNTCANVGQITHIITTGLDWIVQCLTSPPTQYRLYGRRFLQVKRPNQQYQRTEGSYKRQIKQRKQHTHMQRQ